MAEEHYNIGFTGTQSGMTDAQKSQVKHYLNTLPIVEVHHGDCIGSDADFHKLSEEKGLFIIIHPPSNPKKRANCVGNLSAVPKEYLKRNRDIVESSDLVIATPEQIKEELRSGTWSTIRYAKKLKKRVIIIYPDGKVETK